MTDRMSRSETVRALVRLVSSRLTNASLQPASAGLPVSKRNQGPRRVREHPAGAERPKFGRDFTRAWRMAHPAPAFYRTVTAPARERCVVTKPRKPINRERADNPVAGQLTGVALGLRRFAAWRLARSPRRKK